MTNAKRTAALKFEKQATGIDYQPLGIKRYTLGARSINNHMSREELR